MGTVYLRSTTAPDATYQNLNGILTHAQLDNNMTLFLRNDVADTKEGDLTVNGTLTQSGNQVLHAGNYSSYAIPVSGGTVTGRILLQQNGNLGNIVYSDPAGTYIPRPHYAAFRTTTATITGRLVIKLPPALYNNVSDMLSFWVDIYDYASNESVSIFIYGYAYGANTGIWTNAGATILTPRTDRDYTVRFGQDTNSATASHCVTIGETNSTWSYPQVIVRDFQAGYSASPDTFDDGWAVFFSTVLPTVTYVTSSGNTVVAKQLQTSRTISMSGDVSWSVSFAGNSNVTATATLANSGVTSGTYGSTTSVPQLSIDSKGRITSASSITIPTQTQFLGSAATKAIAYNAQTISESITINADQNAFSAGPITISNGFTVTISSGGNWVIV